MLVELAVRFARFNHFRTRPRKLARSVFARSTYKERAKRANPVSDLLPQSGLQRCGTSTTPGSWHLQLPLSHRVHVTDTPFEYANACGCATTVFVNKSSTRLSFSHWFSCLNG